MKIKLTAVETYRIDTEDEVQRTIEDEKKLALEKGYVLKSYKSKMKEKKSKGEVIDSGYEVTFTREFNTFWEA